ncbi:MAG TPA: T9SS type A sorting domain-containing protein [Bacteroidia bacterium]|nr:T9SS type A sorting domain-containing protein [Bacteroidia bacterium]
MNKLYCLIIMFFTCRVCEAQFNLVPNPGFEQFSSCPFYFGDIPRAIGWNIPLFSTTPDYFNACSINLNIDVPQNLCGYESARTGDAYTGIVTFHIQQQTTHQINYREYIQCELTDSLIAGVNYCISWYVSPCDSCYYVCNNMGMLFSHVQINDTCLPANPCNLNYLPQLENPSTNNLNNPNGWTQISGAYTATGGEKYIIIGNFRDTSGTTGSYTGWGAPTGGDLNYVAFYFIDDILVAPCDSLTGMSETNFGNECNLFPNPFSDKINITAGRNEIMEMNLFDITSRKLLQQKFISSVTVNTTQLSKAIYLYELRDKNGVIKKGKVVKE